MKPIALVLSLLSASLLANTSVADETYICLHGDSERKISVVYNTPTSTVPCEVIYEKASGSQVLWNAQNQEGYCESKASEFVEKQRGWGWDCAKMNSASAEESKT